MQSILVQSGMAQALQTMIDGLIPAVGSIVTVSIILAIARIAIKTVVRIALLMLVIFVAGAFLLGYASV